MDYPWDDEPGPVTPLWRRLLWPMVAGALLLPALGFGLGWTYACMAHDRAMRPVSVKVRQLPPRPDDARLETVEPLRAVAIAE
jgi:hypothetical protein